MSKLKAWPNSLQAREGVKPWLWRSEFKRNPATKDVVGDWILIVRFRPIWFVEVLGSFFQ